MKNRTKILKLLNQLEQDVPLTTHLSNILEEYSTFEMLPDKEFLFLLEKYLTLKELDRYIPHDNSIERIIQEAQDLTNILDDGYEEE